MKRILLIGPLNKKVKTGVSLAFLSLLEGLKSKKVPHKLIDVLKAGRPKNPGRFSFARCVQVMIPLIGIYLGMPTSRGCYYLISITRAGFLRDFLVIWWAVAWRKRIVVHLNSAGYMEFYPAQPSWFRWVIRKTLSRCDRIVTLGESIRHQFAFVSDPENRVVVIPNGPPPDCPEHVNSPKTLESDPRIRILYLSNMIPSKGFFDVAKAAKILESRFPGKYCFDFCGAFNVSNEQSSAPKDASEFLNTIREWNLESVVTYHGTVQGLSKERLFKAANIFVLPTKYPTEGQPISIIEAMAYSIPVIATRWKGVVEQVLDGKTGYFVDFFNPEDIAEKISKATASTSHYERLSKQSYLHYQRNFTRKAHVEKMLNLFHEVFDL